MLNFDFYSPEEEVILPLYETNAVRVFVKRDDKIHPYISGNKWRKLKYPLQEAQEQGKRLLVTFGGCWSNHLLATACAGAKFGFRTFAFVRGEEIENPVLTLCRLFGMELQFVDRESYRHKPTLFQTYFGANPEAYFIDEGGYSEKAALGCSEIVDELTRVYDYCFCAAGTGATLAGLSMGIERLNLPTQLHGVPVLKGGSFIADEMRNLGATDKQLTLHLGYHFGGYAKTKPELITFVKNYTQQTAILIEPTYTGKAFYAFHDLLKKGDIPKGSTILLIHTGGLTGILGMLDKF